MFERDIAQVSQDEGGDPLGEALFPQANNVVDIPTLDIGVDFGFSLTPELDLSSFLSGEVTFDRMGTVLDLLPPEMRLSILNYGREGYVPGETIGQIAYNNLGIVIDEEYWPQIQQLTLPDEDETPEQTPQIVVIAPIQVASAPLPPPEDEETRRRNDEIARQLANNPIVQAIGLAVVSAVAWPIDLVLSLVEFIKKPSLGTGIQLALSLPIFGVIGKIGNLLGNIPGVSRVANAVGDAIHGVGRALGLIEDAPTNILDNITDLSSEGLITGIGETPHHVPYNPDFPGRPDPNWSIDARAFDPDSPSATLTEMGEVRDLRQFWEAWTQLDDQLGRQTLSEDNIWRIEHGFSPRVNEQWEDFFPEHRPFRGQRIEHHHLNQGRYTIPLPFRLHRGRGNWQFWHNR